MSVCKFNSIIGTIIRAALILTAVSLCLAVFSGCSSVGGSSAPILGDFSSERSPVLFNTSPLSTIYGDALPSISAVSAILIDADSGTVIGAKAPDVKMSMASTTKIMTALVAIESADISQKVSVSPCAVGVEGSSIYLYEGERLTLEELLYAMLLESANDAAAAIAIAVGGSIEDFAALMNEKANDLGLESTHFTNPHGLDDGEHYTTARELAIIAAEAMRNETFRKIVSTYKKTIPLNETEGVRLLINHNKLLKGYDGAVGIKTGYTKKSGRCLVSAAERDGVRLICVTLSAPDDWQDHKTLLDFGFSSYESRLLCEDGDFKYILPIIGGDKEYVTLTNKGELRVTLPKDAPDIKATVELFPFEYAPVSKGEILGKVVYKVGVRTVAEMPLYSEFSSDRTIYKKSLIEKITSLFYK